MKNFRVEWQPDAQDDLADIWLRAANRQEVTLASRLIDAKLADKPAAWGKELSEGIYRLTVSPVRVLYSIDASRQLVEVHRAFPA